MKLSREWEKVNDGTSRLETPQGWLVNIDIYGEQEYSTAMCFVPDEAKEWELEED